MSSSSGREPLTPWVEERVNTPTVWDVGGGKGESLNNTKKRNPDGDYGLVLW